MATRLRRPESVRLELTQNDWLVVKKFLTAGDTAYLFKNSTESMMVGEQRQTMKNEEYGFHLCSVYLLDWSMTDFNDEPVQIREDRYDFSSGVPREDTIVAYLKNLPTPDYTEILNAVQAHEQRMSAELVKEKNVQSGDLVSLASSSPVV